MYFKKIFLIIITTLIITFPKFVLAADTPIPSFFGFDTSTPQSWINSVYRYGISLIALLALAGIVYGGFRYLTSAGNEEAATSGKQAIFAALSGLVIALLSHMILKQLDPRLVELRLNTPEVDLGESNTSTSEPLYSGEVGSPCLSIRDNCNEGLTCIVITGSTQKCTDGARNSPCASDENCRAAGTHCDEGSRTCVREGEEPTGLRADRAHCTNSNECQSGICLVPPYSICANGTNSRCGTGRDCQDTHYCQDYRETPDRDNERHCRPKRSIGATCYLDGACESGNCDRGTWGSSTAEGTCGNR